jgi:protein-tyrosine phosphatase
MIDLHNHILPCVDDGARDIDEAMAMARQAVSQGTTILAATPHRFHGGREQVAEFIETAVAGLQNHIYKNKIPLRIIAGVEAPMRPDTAEMIKRGTLIALGGSAGRHVLIEPPFDRIPSNALQILESILELRYVPLLAHPERNAEIQKSLAFLETCAGLGIPMQVTAGAIVGKFGAKPQRCAQEIVRNLDWKIVIASDAHDMLDRTPADMTEAVETVAEWIGDHDAALRMAVDNPRSLLPV